MDTEKIFRLQQEINKLLDEHPEYKPFQAEIQSKLKNAGNSHNRMVILKQMMSDRLIKLQELWGVK